VAGIDTIQPFCQPGDVAGSDAFAGIRDAEMSARMVHLPPNTDFRLVRGMSDGIGYQI
jgi:hypothetical protein